MDVQQHARIHPVILCGGSGTRLWPASRESMPKQFARLVDPGRSTFQGAIGRVSDARIFERPVIMASDDSRFIVAEQMRQVGAAGDIVLEPSRRDSAAAVAAATLHAARRDPKALVFVMAADHVIPDTEAFVAAVTSAAAGAAAGHVMTLGILPASPATAYGYILKGAALNDVPGAHEVERFVEKPDAESAGRLMAKGALWNGGYFLFRADVMTAEMSAFAPDVLAAADAALREASVDLDFVRLGAAAFSAAPRTSVDYAVMERTRKAAVLPVSFPWSDVGTWEAVWEVMAKDADGNATSGRVEAFGSRDCLVVGDAETLTAVVGLEGVVVVTTPDAVLVASKARSGEVKALVEGLRSRACPEADAHRRIYRPWGWYQRVDLGQRFQVKRIMVHPGGRLSLQKHHHRAEHWVVVRGTAEVTLGDDVGLVHENEAVYLPIGSVHRLANPGRIPLELVEVQVGSYTGEDDIVRIEDAYGR